MKTAFLFPGQGSQHPGMLRAYSIDEPIVRATFSDIRERLTQPVESLDNENALSSTVNVQLCLFIAGVISARKAMAQGIVPDFVAGHSIGAFAAAVICGTLSFKDALSLVISRAELMKNIFPAGFGMAAIVGFSESRLQSYLTTHNLENPAVYLANINSADQMVVAGKTKSIEVLINSLWKHGIRKATLLNVSVPSHCVLMVDISEALEAQLHSMALKDPAIPYASNSTGRLLKTAEGIKMDLWKSISTPVRWHDATTLLYEYGSRIFIEMVPAGILSKIAVSSFPEASVIGLSQSNTEQMAWLWNDLQRKNSIN